MLVFSVGFLWINLGDDFVTICLFRLFGLLFEKFSTPLAIVGFNADD
jgi:hypothetical protein